MEGVEGRRKERNEKRNKIIGCFLFVCLFVLYFQDQVSLYSPSCPGTQVVDQAGLELRNPPAFAFPMLGLEACATTARLDNWNVSSSLGDTSPHRHLTFTLMSTSDRIIPGKCQTSTSHEYKSKTSQKKINKLNPRRYKILHCMAKRVLSQKRKGGSISKHQSV